MLATPQHLKPAAFYNLLIALVVMRIKRCRMQDTSACNAYLSDHSDSCCPFSNLDKQFAEVHLQQQHPVKHLLAAQIICECTVH